jgi:hypothetical protein
LRARFNRQVAVMARLTAVATAPTASGELGIYSGCAEMENPSFAFVICASQGLGKVLAYALPARKQNVVLVATFRERSLKAWPAS